MFQLTIHMVCSVDGMIAKKDNSVDWFETPDYYEDGMELSAQDTANFLKTTDCYVMGARTYEHALHLSAPYGWPYGDVPVMVVSHKNQPIERPGIEIYSDDLNKLVDEWLKPRFKNVWVVGGAMLAREFMRLKLADKIRLSVLPIILGNGTCLFDDTLQKQALHLQEVRAYKSGMVEYCYDIKK